jgi:hypothetical protein
MRYDMAFDRLSLLPPLVFALAERLSVFNRKDCPPSTQLASRSISSTSLADVVFDQTSVTCRQGRRRRSSSWWSLSYMLTTAIGVSRLSTINHTRQAVAVAPVQLPVVPLLTVVQYSTSRRSSWISSSIIVVAMIVILCSQRFSEFKTKRLYL